MPNPNPNPNPKQAACASATTTALSGPASGEQVESVSKSLGLQGRLAWPVHRTLCAGCARLDMAACVQSHVARDTRVT